MLICDYSYLKPKVLWPLINLFLKSEVHLFRKKNHFVFIFASIHHSCQPWKLSIYIGNDCLHMYSLLVCPNTKQSFLLNEVYLSDVCLLIAWEYKCYLCMTSYEWHSELLLIKVVICKGIRSDIFFNWFFASCSSNLDLNNWT